MRISKFQFSNPVLLEMRFAVNGEFQKNSKQQLNMNTKVTVERSKENNTAVVTIVVEIGEESSRYPYFILVKEQANFSWETDEGTEQPEEIHRLLHQNAPALLMGYIRPVVATVTNNSPYPVLNIPFLDFTKASSDEESSQPNQ